MRRGASLAACLLWSAVPALSAPPPPWTIGLFVPGPGATQPLGGEMLRGARTAVEQVNRGGGVAGRPLRLVEAASDLPWQGATRELVRILYDEEAVAVIGAPDGRSAHFAEQVVTRARGATLFLTPWATETTLTRVRIPWFFQIVPDDRRQAAAMARDLFEVRRIPRVAMLTEDSFDGRSRADAFLRIAPPGSTTSFPEEDRAGWERLIRELEGGGFGALVLMGSPEAGAELMGRLEVGAASPPILAPLSLAVPGFLNRPGRQDSPRVRLVFPAGYGQTAAAREFGREYRRLYGCPAGAAATLTYDAVRVVAEAIRRNASGRSENLAEDLAAVRWEGASGPIRFDRFLGRDGEPVLAEAEMGGVIGGESGAEAGER